MKTDAANGPANSTRPEAPFSQTGAGLNSEFRAEKLTGGRLLAKNSIFNLVGQGVPLVVALIAIPALIHGLGTDRFGVLILAWMVIGYFSLFDLGLGRALTYLVSEKLGAGEEAQLPIFVWTTFILMFALGLLGTVIAGVLSPWLVHSVLKIPEPLQAEALNGFYLLAISIPIVIITAGLSGVLSAFQRFAVLNAVRIPLGIYSFLAPLLVLQFSKDLFLITAALVTGRLIACGVYLAVCLHAMPALRSCFAVRYAVIKPLFHFGAWMTVTNVIGPLMVYLDRFVIGAIVSVAAVAYYATPYEMVTKLWIIPGAILGVLFPAFAASYRTDRDRTARLFARGTKYVALTLFPVTLVITAFAYEGLQWWLGDEFARQSTSVLQCLAIGVFINSLAMVFITLIQGIGRPDLSAKLHLLELPIYLSALWWAIHAHGILGAALAWTGRVVLDGILLFWLSSRFVGGGTALFKRMSIGISAALGGLVAPLLVDGLVSRAATASLTLAVFASAAWFAVLAPDERVHIRGWIGWLTGRRSGDVRK